MILRRFGILATTAVLLAGCKPEQKPGEIGTALAAPGDTMVLGTSTLLVSNVNFQLRYQSGSIEAIDLGLVDETKRLNVIDDVVESAVPMQSFNGQMALTPDGTKVMVTNRLTEGAVRSRPDHLFFVDVTNPAALADADIRPADPGVQSDLVVGEDPYGVVAIAVPPEGPGRPARDRAFVANATSGDITVVNLSAGTLCENHEPAPCILDAFGQPHASPVTFADVGTNSDLVFDGVGTAPLTSITQHWDVTFIETSTGGCPAPTDGSPPGYWRVDGSISGTQQRHGCTGIDYLTGDLVEFSISRATDSDGNPVGGPPSTGDRFSFDVFSGDLEVPSSFPLGQTIPRATLTGKGVGQELYDPFRHRLYLTSRFTNFVYVLDAIELRLLGVFATSTNVTGRDNRGLALSPDGSELYVANRAPDALLVIDPDALPVQLEPKLVDDGVIASIATGSAPSEVTVSADGRYAFVTAFNDDRIDVLDLELRTLVSTARTGHGPYGMRLSPDGKRGYIAIYLASAIDVMDTDPSSPTFGTILTTIANAGYRPENKE